ncbi:SDR family NAD(P)-dependent oxidoreductase [Jeotgalibacillus proteolyticus]|uniref:2-deoxy-D-gluconate 3-dehydrogenase n=1 Tax=Jeotgalibacillus proteolyticus TaxID=2082395 RepID=A0A2S5GE78_9BACL|nr:glucose 1-dehydrogenase [Jeotgalibacillus proteolyticus]PPA71221.1 2-deoxy-D-gluconate 3-dehydrogenase [Jeotgalibacillus proteolyticus]
MYKPSFRLDGKTAIITGAGRGIGRALAIGLSEAGAEVALFSRTVSDLEETSRLIHENGGRAHYFPVDVTDRRQVTENINHVKEKLGKIDILVNNAGMNIRSKAADVTDEEWNVIMDTNLKSAFMLSQEAGKIMKDQPSGGSILSVSSVAGQTALRTGVVYGASKAALIQMTKVLAYEWGQNNIRVNSIGPWYFETPLTETMLANEDYLNDILAVTPLRRVGQLKELVGPAIFLVSDAGSYVTGQTLFVDGGMTINGF